MFNNKKILITGGTGSFGQEFTKYILTNYKPKKLIIYSRDELKQYEMENKFKHEAIRFFIGDVRDKDRLTMAMREVDYVIHAAALKQVPIAEYNPIECIQTNVIGAQNVISASIAAKVKKVLALSTDKATSPINLYGASKLAAEKLFIAANALVGFQETYFSVVRYGNVVNSRGSVIPLFEKLMKERSNTFPITDENMTRFFITLPQAVKFVVKCFKTMKKGEVFIPKIPSFKIVDLAKALNPKVKFNLIGVRPGEKIDESLCSEDESSNLLEFKDYFALVQLNTGSIKNKKILKKRYNNSKIVKRGFSYTSKNNSEFLNVAQIKKLLKNI
tara:strand:+ start:1172 stop:2164 length:993 start_codon:yes stop_codon:yes gene_type:complete